MDNGDKGQRARRKGEEEMEHDGKRNEKGVTRWENGERGKGKWTMGKG